jgi:hypothetical protein
MILRSWAVPFEGSSPLKFTIKSILNMRECMDWDNITPIHCFDVTWTTTGIYHQCYVGGTDTFLKVTGVQEHQNLNSFTSAHQWDCFEDEQNIHMGALVLQYFGQNN